jgi:hypothetical protein
MSPEADLQNQKQRQHGYMTSASSHPELLSGDLAIPPRQYTSITSINRSIASGASRRTFGISVPAIVALLSTIVFKSGSASYSGHDNKQALARLCLHWHLAASVAVSRLVRSSRDADLQQAIDAIFQMRRARQNCDTGSRALACRDYQTVAARLPGYTLANPLSQCPPVDSAARIETTPDRNQ